MKLGIIDFLEEMIPLLFNWQCYFNHKYIKINYRGKMKDICIRCNIFRDGGSF